MPLTMMAVHAHPDDECITTGGVLCKYSDEGVETVVVTCTGGEAGEIAHPSLATPETLAAVRTRELAEALRILGVRHHRTLGYRDSGMMSTPDNRHPDAFWRADLDEATGKLVALVRELRPQVIIAYNENGDYGHPDHINAHRIAVAAYYAAGDPNRYPEQGLSPWKPSKLYYSAWPRSHRVLMTRLLAEAGLPDPWGEDDPEWTVPDEDVTTRVDVAAYTARRRAALMAHKTQVPEDSAWMTVPEAIWSQLDAEETFRRAHSRIRTELPEDDLFAGLRTSEG